MARGALHGEFESSAGDEEGGLRNAEQPRPMRVTRHLRGPSLLQSTCARTEEDLVGSLKMSQKSERHVAGKILVPVVLLLLLRFLFCSSFSSCGRGWVLRWPVVPRERLLAFRVLASWDLRRPVVPRELLHLLAFLLLFLLLFLWGEGGSFGGRWCRGSACVRLRVLAGWDLRWPVVPRELLDLSAGSVRIGLRPIWTGERRSFPRPAPVVRFLCSDGGCRSRRVCCRELFGLGMVPGRCRGQRQWMPLCWGCTGVPELRWSIWAQVACARRW